MQTDFHFYGVAVLARAAGFSQQHALTIAYASQYTDDSTESAPIDIGGFLFDPIRTAHNGLGIFHWGVQKRIYIPFHFLPPKPIRSAADSFVTVPDSPFARVLLMEAAKEPDRALRLIRLGTALHTYADTFTHAGFSGRESEVNDVENIHTRRAELWTHLLLENIYLDFLPKVGHVQAGHCPDQPALYWKYYNSVTGTFVVRPNPDIFLTAARAMYDRLREFPKDSTDDVIPFGDLEPDLKRRIADDRIDPAERCEEWKRVFSGLFPAGDFHYDRLAWRKEALQPESESDIDWDGYRSGDFRHLSFDMGHGFFASNWVLFHKAALRQRHFVLERLF